jgi:imidazolonepropionase-like amidohydrolase
MPSVSHAILLLGGALGHDEAAADGAFALHAAKLLTCAPGAPVVDDGLVMVRGGKIERVGARDELDVPAGYALVDAGELWVMPGMIDLHSHVGGTDDINDMVFQTNPELRVHPATQPGNELLLNALASGVTTVLFIPGSGTAVSGQGILMKTVPGRYEDVLVRDPGSLKTAQGNNPMAHLTGCGPALYNWHLREIFRRGRAYATGWKAHEEEGASAPDFDLQLEVFRALFAGTAQVSAHTQQHHVVQATLAIQVRGFGVPTFIDHGEMDAFLGTPGIEAESVPAILGPRSVSWQSKGRGIDHDGRMLGLAAEYQARGHTRIGFNTDAPVVPAESLQLQAGMALRYGLDDRDLASVCGLTLVPAETAGIADRVGSLEPGKDADLVLLTGHPADPRTSVERVYVEGQLVYDAREERRW